jgi:hypothetical protein
MGIATDAERQFFDRSRQIYSDIVEARPGIEHKFRQHVKQIETQYHTDKLGQFATLWPELDHLC